MSRIKFTPEETDSFNSTYIEYLMVVDNKDDGYAFGSILRSKSDGRIKYINHGNYSLSADELQLIVDKIRELEAAHG